MIRARIEQIRLAIMLHTRVPSGRLREPAPAIAASAWAFPLAGLVVGALAAAVLTAALALGLPAPLAAGLALIAQVMVTGALHEDGLADCADGFWGGRDRARRLEIMRDSRIGSYGALALILSLGLRWQALAQLSRDPGLAAAALISVAMLSRLAPALVLALLPPARGDGMGRAARDVSPPTLATAALLCLPALALPGALVALLPAAAVLAGLVVLARRKIGGQSGDVLGASQQLTEIALLITLCRH